MPAKAVKRLNGNTDNILTMIANGYSLRKACKAHGLTAAAFLYWCQKDKNLANQYSRARDVQADIHADEVVEIADKEDNPHKARVRIDARKWACAVQAPRKYSEKGSQVVNIITPESNIRALMAGIQDREQAIPVLPLEDLEDADEVS